jgi:Flp pilus assembly protein TadD
MVPTGAGVAFAGIDWKIVHRLNQEAQKLVQEGRITEAIQRLRASLSMVGEQGSVLTTLAGLQEEVGALHDALDTWRRFAAQQPQDSRGPHGEGRVLLRLGRRRQAIERLQRALELDPGDPHIRRLLQDAHAGI